MSSLPTASESGGGTSHEARLRYASFAQHIGSLLLAVALLAAAEIAARNGWVSRFVLPAPSLIFSVLAEGLASGFYVGHIVSSALSIVSGFLSAAVVAIALAAFLISMPALERMLTPFIVAFQSLPKIAIAPLIVLWFGFGDLSKTIIVAAVCFFPILVNTMQGLKIRDRDLYELMRSLGASRSQMFWELRLPQAVPYIFAGLHIGVIFSLIGTVVAEFVGSTAGVGYAMMQAKAAFDVAGVYACLIILMALGIILHVVMVSLEKRVAFWTRDLARVTA